MDAKDFNLAVEYLSCNGTVLSPEQKVILQNSLQIAKRNYKFSTIKLWGKIEGTKQDYYIAYGVTGDEFKRRVFLYSQDGIDWHVLSQPTEDMINRSLLVKQRLTGDPSVSHVCVATQEKLPNRNEQNDNHHYNYDDEHLDTKETEGKSHILEANLLAAIVAQIDEETSIAPRGAYIKTPTGEVHPNRLFNGLSWSESEKLGSYLHFHPSYTRKTEFHKNKGDCDSSFDFTQTIDSDLTSNWWSLRVERGNFVCLSNLQWLGMSFYHKPNTNAYGCLYVGNGRKNSDAPFMV